MMGCNMIDVYAQRWPSTLENRSLNGCWESASSHWKYMLPLKCSYWMDLKGNSCKLFEFTFGRTQKLWRWFNKPPSRQFLDCGRWKSELLWNFTIVGFQSNVNCLMGSTSHEAWSGLRHTCGHSLVLDH